MTRQSVTQSAKNILDHLVEMAIENGDGKLLAMTQERASELNELSRLAERASVEDAIVKRFEQILDRPDLSNEAHETLLLEKQRTEREAAQLHKSLERASQIGSEATETLKKQILVTQLSKHGCMKPELLAAYIKEKHGFEVEVKADESGKPTFDEPRLNAIVREVKDDPSTAPVFSDRRRTEADNGSPDKNPFERGPHFSLTEQGRIYKENPERAKAMMAAAKEKQASAKLNLTELGQLYRENPEKAREKAKEHGLKL